MRKVLGKMKRPEHVSKVFSASAVAKHSVFQGRALKISRAGVGGALGTSGGRPAPTRTDCTFSDSTSVHSWKVQRFKEVFHLL